MIKFKHILFVSVCAIFFGCGAFATELSGVAMVNVTSDTAVDAKNIALAQARRQVINQVLGKYANPSLVQVAVKNSKNTDLMNMVSSTSIDGEKQSDTTYAANVTMVLDSDAARLWLNNNNIQNWLPDSTGAVSGNGAQVFVTMSDRVANWMNLKSVARDIGITVNTKYIMGNRAQIDVPVAKLGAFTSALRANGWGYANQDGIIKIWR